MGLNPTSVTPCMWPWTKTMISSLFIKVGCYGPYQMWELHKGKNPCGMYYLFIKTVTFLIGVCPQHCCNVDVTIIILLTKKLRNTANTWQDQAGSRVSASSHCSWLLFTWYGGQITLSLKTDSQEQRSRGLISLEHLQEEPLWRETRVSTGKEGFVSLCQDLGTIQYPFDPGCSENPRGHRVTYSN